MIVAGGGVRASGAARELVALAEALQIPVATSLNGKDSIPGNHPLSVGVAGTYSRESANKVVNAADLVCFIGTETGGMTTHFWAVPKIGTHAIQIDIDPEALGRNYPLAAAVNGDAKVTLAACWQSPTAPPRRSARAWVAEAQEFCSEWRNKYKAALDSDAVPIRPERLCSELTQHVPDDAIVVVDTGHAGMWMGGMFDLTSPEQSYMRSAGHLGWAFPAGLGAKCGCPERPVVTFTGDAGFWYHIAEIETAVRWGINAVTVVNNNGGGNQSKRGFDRVYGGQQTPQARELWTFSKVNFARLAEDMGALGIRVEHAFGVSGGTGAGARGQSPRRHRRGHRHRGAGADRRELKFHFRRKSAKMRPIWCRQERHVILPAGHEIAIMAGASCLVRAENGCETLRLGQPDYWHSMRTERESAIGLLQLMMVASLVLPAALYSYASWVSYRDTHTVADERITRSLDVSRNRPSKYSRPSTAPSPRSTRSSAACPTTTSAPRSRPCIRGSSRSQDDAATAGHRTDRPRRPAVRLERARSRQARRQFRRPRLFQGPARRRRRHLCERRAYAEFVLRRHRLFRSVAPPRPRRQLQGRHRGGGAAGLFRAVLRQARRGADGSFFALVRDDGSILTRYPERPGDRVQRLGPSSGLRTAIGLRAKQGWSSFKPSPATWHRRRWASRGTVLRLGGWASSCPLSLEWNRCHISFKTGVRGSTISGPCVLAPQGLRPSRVPRDLTRRATTCQRSSCTLQRTDALFSRSYAV